MWEDPLVHALDASACKSMLLRHGSGGLKHLETKNLWVQEAVKSKHIKVVKIAREVNAAVSLACFSATNILRDHMRLFNCELIDNQEHVLVGVSFAYIPSSDSLGHQRLPG